MKRFDTIALIMVGFIAEIAYVYSCGGGGDGAGNGYEASWHPHSNGEISWSPIRMDD